MGGGGALCPVLLATFPADALSASQPAHRYCRRRARGLGRKIQRRERRNWRAASKKQEIWIYVPIIDEYVCTVPYLDLDRSRALPSLPGEKHVHVRQPSPLSIAFVTGAS